MALNSINDGDTGLSVRTTLNAMIALVNQMNPVVQYVSNPNIEGPSSTPLQPVNPNYNAVAVPQNGSGAIYNWNINSQTWV